jgi:hypothetical protein
VAAALGDCDAPILPGALRKAAELNLCAWRYDGTTDLFHTAAFKAGSFEIQDLASQLVGHACAPTPGQSWWDVCAGEGGKTVHLCDLLRNKGLVWATDRSERRLTVLRRRTARAGLFNYQAALWEGAGKLQRGRHLAAQPARALDHDAGRCARAGGRAAWAAQRRRFGGEAGWPARLCGVHADAQRDDRGRGRVCGGASGVCAGGAGDRGDDEAVRSFHPNQR